MSRIGKMPVELPSGVAVAVAERKVTVTRPDDQKRHRELHGLTRTLIANMVNGVTRGFTRNLEIQGVGYRAQMQGRNLNLALGFSHPVVFQAPPGIDIKVEGTNKIHISGADKQQVGQVAAQIRSIRPPEPYKGKGIRYEGERVRRKLGKAGKTAGAKK